MIKDFIYKYGESKTYVQSTSDLFTPKFKPI